MREEEDKVVAANIQLYRKIYFEETKTTVWDSEYVKVIYLGVYKDKYYNEEENFYAINFFVENKTEYELVVMTDNIKINDKSIDAFPMMAILHPNDSTIAHSSLDFSRLFALGVNSLEEINAINFNFLCKDKFSPKQVIKSPFVTLYPMEYLKDIYSDMGKIIKEINDGIIWKEIEKDCLDISFRFKYPDGKQRDVDFYLASEYGKLEQLSSILFHATVSTKYLHIIDLIMFHCMVCSQNSYFMICDNNNELLEFLIKYDNIMKLNHIYCIAKDMNNNNTSNNGIMREAYEIIHNKYLELKNERNKIYSSLVAENKATSKWKSEQQLYAMIKEVYPEAIYQYQTEWLGRQSLDIFIPSLNVGIEYQGRQHYEAINFFGGEEEFEKRKKLDSRKKELCLKNNVKLLEWDYRMEINEENIKKIILN